MKELDRLNKLLKATYDKIQLIEDKYLAKAREEVKRLEELHLRPYWNLKDKYTKEIKRYESQRLYEFLIYFIDVFSTNNLTTINDCRRISFVEYDNSDGIEFYEFLDEIKYDIQYGSNIKNNIWDYLDDYNFGDKKRFAYVVKQYIDSSIYYGYLYVDRSVVFDDNYKEIIDKAIEPILQDREAARELANRKVQDKEYEQFLALKKKFEGE